MIQDGGAGGGGTVTEAGIDRLSTVPYYQQLTDVLERRIVDGELAFGDRLPSEQDLGQHYGLARATVREALRLLEDRGFAQRVTNRGVFVTRPSNGKGWTIQGPEGFLELAVGHQNQSVTTQVLSAAATTLPPHASRLLELADGVQGFRLVRVRSVDGTPALYSVNYSPPALVAVIGAATDVLSGDGSLTDLHIRAGYPLGRAHRAIRAVALPADIAEHLAVPPGGPALHIRSTSWTAEGVHYDVYDTWVRSDLIPLEVEVSAGGTPTERATVG